MVSVVSEEEEEEEEQREDETEIGSKSPFIELREEDIIYRTKQPKMVRQYLFGFLLGKGSYGKVKEAIDIHTEQWVAIKIMQQKQLKRMPGGEEAVKKEISFMRSLEHPHIATLVEAFMVEEKGKLYMATEYIGGGSLQDLLERAPNKRLPCFQARRYFSAILSALGYIHQKSIVHRDVKPDNMMLTTEGVLKLIDFGIAEKTDNDRLLASPQSPGSPAIQPPEVASGLSFDSYSASKVDIWASGICLFAMLTGKYPFEGTTVYTLFENISNCNFSIPSWLTTSSPTACDLLMRILEGDFEKRSTLEQINQHPWMSMDIVPEEMSIIPRPSLFTSTDILEKIKKTNEEHNKEKIEINEDPLFSSSSRASHPPVGQKHKKESKKCCTTS